MWVIWDNTIYMPNKVKNASERKYNAIYNILYWLAKNICNQGFESTNDRLDNNLN